MASKKEKPLLYEIVLIGKRFASVKVYDPVLALRLRQIPVLHSSKWERGVFYFFPDIEGKNPKEAARQYLFCMAKSAGIFLEKFREFEEQRR